MSSFSDSRSKLRRFLARNDGAVVTGLVREAAAKAYRRPAVRSLARTVSRPRQPETWLFAVGCYNSGTTLLRRLLEAHPAIAGLPIEGVKLTDAFADLEAGGWPRMMYKNRHLWDLPDEGASDRVERAVADWSPWWRRGASVFLEKSIDNSTRMRWLDRHFPNARFIAITRNGYCVCEGIRRRAKPQGEAVPKSDDSKEATYPMPLVAEQWQAFCDRIEADIKVVEHGFAFRYEDLTARPVEVMTEMFAFLGVPPIAMSLEGRILTIGDERHEIRDQNAASLSRLSAEEIADATPVMRAALLRNGYQVLGPPDGI